MTTVELKARTKDFALRVIRLVPIGSRQFDEDL